MDKYFIERWHAMLDSCLTEREARLLAQRYQVEEGRINTLQEIADIEGISRERVRQILNKCFRKLVSKANRDIAAGNHDSERAALVHHLRSIVLSSEDGHVDRLVSYLIEEFGHLPADKNSLALLIRLVYRNRQERDQYTVEAQGVLVSRLENAGQQRSTVRGQSWEKLGANGGRSRRAKIVQWLAGSQFAEPDEFDGAFRIRAGNYIRLQNGQRHELLDWLKQEGIAVGSSVGGYRIASDSVGEQNEAQLLFLRTISADVTALGIDDRWELPSPNRRMLNRVKALPIRAYAAWNEAEERDLMELFREDLSYGQLARHFHRVPGAIRSRLKKLDLL